MIITRLAAVMTACIVGGGITTSGGLAAELQFRCDQSRVRMVDREYPGGWNLNRELVANEYAIFAAASADTYRPYGSRDIDDEKTLRRFRIADNDPALKSIASPGSTGWQFIESDSVQLASGLQFDVYRNFTPNHVATLVAYRGTDGWLGNMDLIANLTWFTQWLNPWDQYRQARRAFADIQRRSIASADGRTLSFITTGHSLGGGLAEHVAGIYPCTTSITFNSSFVHNRIYRKFRHRRISIYEVAEVFEQFTPKVRNNDKRAIYRVSVTIEPGAVYNHNSERLAAGLARMAIDCVETNPTCEIEDNAAVARILYCKRYKGVRGLDQRDKLCR